MALVVVTMKIMPKSPNVSLKDLKKEIEKKVKEFVKETAVKFEELPIGFGLSALNVIFVMDEGSGSTDKLEENISSIKGISSAKVVDMRRAIG